MIRFLFTHNTNEDEQSLKQLTTMLKVKLQQGINRFMVHEAFELTEECSTATQMQEGWYKFALAERPLTQSRRWTISFKAKRTDGIGVGVAFHNIHKQYWTYDNLGHFAYMMTYNGYTWSHSDPDVNYAQNGFEFSKDSTIQLYYDYYDQSLEFSCGENTYIMKDVPRGCHPFGMTSYVGDSVTIGL